MIVQATFLRVALAFPYPLESRAMPSSKNILRNDLKSNTGDVSDVVVLYDVVGLFGGVCHAVSVPKRCWERTKQDRQWRET